MGNVFIIAEISANHGNSIDIVKKSIKKVKEIGADAVKIQTYKPETITLNSEKECFVIKQKDSLWSERKLFDLYSEGMLPWEWHEELFEYAESIGIILFSTPFDNTAVDLLEKCGNPIYKIASFEINDIPLIRYAASKMKPMIISTGIATLNEIEEAISACHEEGNYDITLLKCTSEYPAKLEDANLIMIRDLKEKFNVKTGLSDHTVGSIAPIVAVSLGAEVIEKHFILDRSIGGPDASFSMDAEEFEKMIVKVRAAQKTIGIVDYQLTESKIQSRKFRRSLFISEDVKAGDIITMHNIRSVRPGDGLEPKYYKDVLGKKFNKDLDKGTPLMWENFS